MKPFRFFVAASPLAVSFTQCIRHIAIIFALLLLAATARAVTGPNATETNGFPWVVPLSFGPDGLSFLGSGSYITNGVVLTASHNVNTANLVTPGGVTNGIGQTADRVTIGGQQYFALGVQDPLYTGASADPNDIGLYLVLNQPAVPGGVFPTLATTNDAPLTTGSIVSVLGYGKSTNGLPIFGTMMMTNAAQTAIMTGGIPNVTANTYAFTKPGSSELTDGGDSGGPYISNNKIVAVHTTGFTTGTVKTAAMGVRVDSHTDFVTGNGQNVGGGVYQSTLVRFVDGGNTTWSTAARWGRATTNAAVVPQNNDIAILDPTVNSDSGITVTLDVDSANLNGLLNDVNLQVNGHRLSVTGGSGALNGGIIGVGGGAGSVMNIASSLDNEGTVNVTQNGQAYIGSGLATGYTTYNTALFNGSNSTVTVTASSLAVTNVNRHTQILNSDASSTITLQGDGSGAGTITADRVDSYGLVQLQERSLLDLDNAYFNEIPGRLFISGGATGNSTGDVFQLINWGTVNVNTGGVLVADAIINNFGPMSVIGGSVLTTNFNVLAITNFGANLAFTARASTTGTVLMTSGNFGVTNAAKNAQLLVTTGTFTMNGGNLNADRIVVTNGALSQFALNGGVVTSSFTSVGNGSTFYVGSNAVAASLVLIDNTHTFNNGLDIATTANSTGSVFFGGSQLIVTNNMIRVGVLGSGQMTVSNGTVSVGASTGPTPLLVGALDGSQGTLTINSGTLNSAGPLRIGDTAAATGTVWVTGGQMVTTNTFSFVGNAGTGQLTMSNGMYLSAGIVVGFSAGSQGLYTMAGGTNILSGSFPNLSAGDQAGATGTVLMTGGSIVVTNGSTMIGNSGIGQLIISNTTMQARDVTIAAQLGSRGTFTLNMGTLTTSGLLNNTNGFIKGVGTIDGSVVSAGTISPGFSPGRIFITSNLTLQATSTVLMELGGTATNEYDQIFIGQNWQAGGTLSVSLINAFDPALSNSFHIFDFASSGGDFSVTNLPALDPGLGWDTSELMSDGDITVVGVPEPSTCVLVFGACAGLSLLRRKKRNHRPLP